LKAPSCPFNEIAGKIKMLSMEVRTSLSAGELTDRLKGCFGTDGLGLALKEDCPGRLAFTGGGGHVTATFCAESEKTVLRIVTSGWVAPVKKFIADLP
jgi:hypothetical protein